MNQTSGDSRARIVCMAIEKENEKGLVISSGEKQPNLLGIEIELEDSILQKNDVLVTQKGTIKFPPTSYAKIIDARKDRKVKTKQEVRDR